MSSALSAPAAREDLSARARIRETAIRRFDADGTDTPLRAILRPAPAS